MIGVDNIITEIIAELSIIRQSIKDKNFKEYAIDTLVKREKELQDKLNELLKSKGLKISDSEADKIYEELMLQKKSKLEANLKRGKTGFYIAGVLLVLGLYFAFKKFKK